MNAFQKRIYSYVKENSGVRIHEAVKYFNRSREEIFSALHDLRCKGLVRSEQPQVGYSAFIWYAGEVNYIWPATSGSFSECNKGYY